MQYLATVQPPEHAARLKWNRTSFYEWIVFSFLRYLLKHPDYRERHEVRDEDDPYRTLDAREAFELLKHAGWYEGKGLRKEVSFSIWREANIAFGFWYRTTPDFHDKQIYHELINSLLSSGFAKDREIAFFLIRHSEPTSRQLAIEVSSEFRPALEVIARDSRLESIHTRYANFFRCNKVPLAANKPEL
jgi:hypothetical protein